MTEQKVFIIILNYNSWQDTIECITSILKQSYKNYEIIAVDNNSTDDSKKMLLQYAETTFAAKGYTTIEYKKNKFVTCQAHEDSVLTIISSDVNGGYASGNNIGIQYCSLAPGEHFIWVLNNDTVIPENTLQLLTECFQKNTNQNVGIAGCVQKYYANPQIIQALYGNYNKFLGTPNDVGKNINVDEINFSTLPAIDYISGACFLTTTTVLKKIGGLNEQYFLYFEELDLAERIKQNGYSLVFCSNAHILHKHGTSIGSSSSKDATDFADFHFFKSKFIFIKKYHPFFLPSTIAFTGLQVISRLIGGKKNNALAILKACRVALWNGNDNVVFKK